MARTGTTVTATIRLASRAKVTVRAKPTNTWPTSPPMNASDLSLVEGVRRALVAMSNEFEGSKAIMLMRAQLVAVTPALRVHVLQREQEWVEEFSAAIAARMNLDQASDLRPELAAAMIVTAFRVVLGQWLRKGGEGDMPAMLDQALAFIGNGLGVDTA